MDVNKRQSNARARQGLEMPNSFPEQYSDASPSNNGMQQHSNKAANSPCEEDNGQHVLKTENNDLDTLGNSSSSSVNLSSPNSKKSLSKQASLSKIKPSSAKSIRDELDIKKEDVSLSPQNVSPLDFVPSSAQSNCENDDNSTHNKSAIPSPLSCEKNATFQRSGCSDMEERPTSASLAISGNASTNLDSGAACNMLGPTSHSPKTNSDGFNSNVSNMPNMPRNLMPFGGGGNMGKFNYSTGEGPAGMNASSSGGGNSGGGGGGSGGNEYMSQQNHVFVFSTQLANKSAEAVMAGQFPTIIAYHCMQPSTKLFLEDFLKNPAKTTKLQRQYSLNLMNVMSGGAPGPGGQPFWLNDSKNSGNFQNRLGNRNVSGGGGGGNKNNPGGWDQAAAMDNQQACPPANALDLLNNSESFENSKGALCGIKSEDKSCIPSLQGVKVPDENLTPQQRQHREEQLAKLKKMNKFLFPENEGGSGGGGGSSGEFHAGQGNNLPSSESGGPNGPNSLPSNPVDMLHNAAGNCPDLPNKMFSSAMRNIAGNMPKQGSTGPGAPNLDNVPNLSSDSNMPPDMMANSSDSSNLGVMQSHNKQGCLSKMNTSNLNMLKSRGMGEEPGNSPMESNAPDMTSSFNMNSGGPSSETDAAGGPSHMNMPPEEWAKFQNRPGGGPLGLPGQPPGCQQNTPLARSLSMSVSGYGMQNRPNTGPSSTNRNNNGPPPPYHQTQRSASVPIATQSPTHPNSNNSNSDMPPLPSPQGSHGPFGVSSTPPNMSTVDMKNASGMMNNSTHSAVNAPTSMSGGMPTGNVAPNSSMLNSMSSNQPPHQLSHMSARDMDCLDTGHKMKRSSPQKFKGPLMNDGPPDNMCMDPKYSNFPLNYPTCGGMPPMNAQNMRQNMQQMPSQFHRRIDNIPLNPNCNRISQNKPSSGFDPISSLAQMSQSLTGCGVGLNSIGAGGGAGNSGSVGGGLMDVNPNELMGGPSNRGGAGDHPMDHCNQLPNANNMGMMGMSSGMGRPGQFPNDMNSMLCGEPGPMDQRMLNGKMCVPNMPGGNFNPNALNGMGLRELRDSNLGCNEMMSSNRAMNRRMPPTNFDNFNMSPNVHVKVSAPNTIQYMPARSQNMNNMNNMRVPPSMEFFQRYANPQAMGNMGGMGHPHPSGGHMGHMPNDMQNPNMMNMFGGNCNQMPGGGMGQLGGGGGGVGFEPNDLEVEGNLLAADDFMNVR